MFARNKPAFSKVKPSTGPLQESIIDEVSTFDSESSYHNSKKIRTASKNLNMQPAMKAQQICIRLQPEEQITVDHNTIAKHKAKHMKIEQLQNIDPQLLSVSDIKQFNSRASCSDFIFCSSIPIRAHKATTNWISVSDLAQQADSFDILLFKNSSALSRVQRFVTRSDYDHVGMIVTLGQDRYLLQATGSHGVSMCSFQKFATTLATKKNIKYQVGYRRFQRQLYNNQTYQKLQQKLQQFLKRTLGKKYKFSPIYLFSKEHKKEEQTYFCSQLIAECFSYCGVARLNQPAYAILPRDFCNKKTDSDEQFMEISSSRKKVSGDWLELNFEQLKTVQLRSP